MPYLYSLGAPDLRDRRAVHARAVHGLRQTIRQPPTIGDEYMLGPAFLVAPVTEQGVTSRRVYLPAGADWYDWWTRPAATAAASGSPPPRRSTASRCSCAPDRSCRSARRSPTRRRASRWRRSASSRAATPSFALYDDDGITNAYRKGGRQRDAALGRWRAPSVRLGAAADRTGTGSARPGRAALIGASAAPRVRAAQASLSSLALVPDQKRRPAVALNSSRPVPSLASEARIPGAPMIDAPVGAP